MTGNYRTSTNSVFGGSRPLTTARPLASRATLETTAPAGRLEAVAHWIGRPEGRGVIAPVPPELGILREVHTFEADGRLGIRRIRIQERLGSGLAGTVYLAEDDAGVVYVEKHYGAIPAQGAKKLGRILAEAIFTCFRQAPLSFRELPEAAIANHLTNRFVVALSRARFGRAITPPLLYTRYDEHTGGYAQAFAFVAGRPLQPWKPGLPMLGEAGTFFKSMQRWRDFLAKELGFWGLARQVDPANPNSFSNVWITPDDHVLLLDIVPGVPGFLEPRYLWWGLLRGHLPPFGDAIDFNRLAAYLRRHPLPPVENTDWNADFALLEEAVMRWQNSEPRLCSAPLRLVKVLRDPAVRQATRVALLRHLEVKGAISRGQAEFYRPMLAATGRFPKLLRHSLLKMAPLPLHRALTDGTYALSLLRQSFSLPLRVVRGVARRLRRIGAFVVGTAKTVWPLLTNRQARLQRCRQEIDAWIDEEQDLGRLSPRQAGGLRHTLHEDEEIADLAELFALHLLISAAKQSLLGPLSSVFLASAIMLHDWRLALPALIDPTLRVLAVLAMGLGRYLGLLLFSALPTVGILATPLHLLERRPALGGFILRAFGRKAALHLPGFGERGALSEMLGVAAVQVLLIDPARMLPPVLVVAMLGLVSGQHALLGLATWAYAVTVLWRLDQRHREANPTGVFRRVSAADLAPRPQWQLGLSEPFSIPQEASATIEAERPCFFRSVLRR